MPEPNSYWHTSTSVPTREVAMSSTVQTATDIRPFHVGGKAEDAFHLVMPSIPGYGFSGEPAAAAVDRAPAAVGG
jgi:hypothetical protein